MKVNLETTVIRPRFLRMLDRITAAKKRRGDKKALWLKGLLKKYLLHKYQKSSYSMDHFCCAPSNYQVWLEYLMKYSRGKVVCVGNVPLLEVKLPNTFSKKGESDDYSRSWGCSSMIGKICFFSKEFLTSRASEAIANTLFTMR